MTGENGGRNLIWIAVILILAAGVIFFLVKNGKKTDEEAPVTEVITEDVTTETPAPEEGLITEDEARELLIEKFAEATEIMTIFFNGNVDTDPDQTLPGDDAYKLVLHSQLSSIQALKDYAENVFTPELAESDLGYATQFEGETPHFKEADGFLYLNEDIGGRDISADWHAYTATIVSQTVDSLTVAVDLYRFDEFESRQELTLVKTAGGNWVFATSVDQ